MLRKLCNQYSIDPFLKDIIFFLAQPQYMLMIFLIRAIYYTYNMLKSRILWYGYEPIAKSEVPTIVIN